MDFIEFKDDKDLSLVNDVFDVKDENLQDAKYQKYQISNIKNQNIKLENLKQPYFDSYSIADSFFAIFY